ncbi:translation initiation factor IF-3 [Candidatus Gracilibacteria bacterium]|nr:translation initiation factor IF-3 [Candidatus Gracilibacteria bacterium]NUJ98812.1 translation initiation factor IF-3 [Candidatus Gracilibacteria bacterium]
MKENKKPLNHEIKASQVQVIDEKGENLGEMSLQEALLKAEEDNLDLMEIGRKDNVAIVKMLNFGKFIYKQKKQEQKQKQKGKVPELKTIRITFRIGEHDLEIRKNQAEKFAIEGHPLKVILVMKGRENQYIDIAREKMRNFVISLDGVYKIEKDIVQNGNNLVVNLKTIK